MAACIVKMQTAVNKMIRLCVTEEYLNTLEKEMSLLFLDT